MIVDLPYSHKWSEAADNMLRELHGTMTIKSIADAMGRTHGAIRARVTTLQLAKKNNAWSEQEIERLRAAYLGATLNTEINLTQLAEDLGRHKSNVCRKARQLGFTDNARKSVLVWKDRKKYQTQEERSAAASVRQKEHLLVNGHPRGMLGKTHSLETRRRLSKTSTAAQAKVSLDERGRRVTQALHTRLETHGSLAPPRPSASWKAGWREIGGRRNYYRSRWEANYARYLEWLKQQGQIKDWQHEPETFWFEKIKRGVRSYLPDFRVWENDGTSKLHEVKGWMDGRSKTTLARMKRYHPHETIIVIRERDYNAIARTVSRMIEGWEHSDRKDRL